MTTRSIWFDLTPPPRLDEPLAVPAHSSPKKHTGNERPAMGGWDERRRAQSLGQFVVMNGSGRNRSSLLVEHGALAGFVATCQLLNNSEAPNPARRLGLTLRESSEL